jgi:DNA-directed RNA polymerase specialized sigma24 family protein
MQEMYFSLLRSLSKYRSEELRKTKEFSAVVFYTAYHDIWAYQRKQHGRSFTEDGKEVIREAPISLYNSDGENSPYLLDLIKDEIDIEEEVIEKLNNSERREALRRLYDEIDKLSPLQKTVIIDYYKKGKNLYEISFETHQNYNNVMKISNRALSLLRDNPNVQEIAAIFDIKQNEKRENRALYRLIDTEAVKGLSSLHVSRLTILSEPTVDYIKQQKNVQEWVAKTFAAYMRKPLDELFELVSKKEPTKRNYQPFYTARNPLFFYDRSYTDFEEQLIEQEVSRANFNKHMRKLRNGGCIMKASAERYAALFGNELFDLFVPYDGRPTVTTGTAYIAIDRTAFENVTTRDISSRFYPPNERRYINSALKCLSKGGKVFRENAERVAALYNRPLNELFTEVVTKTG